MGRLAIRNVSKNTHILSCISLHSRFAAGLPGTRSDKSLMRNVGRCQNCSVSQDLSSFLSLQLTPIVLVIFEPDPVIHSPFVILDHAAYQIIPSFVVLLRSLLGRSVSSILQFLPNLRSIPGEDGSSSPVHYTSVFSLAELGLPIDWPSILEVFEIQAPVVTRLMHILVFSLKIFDLHVGIESSIFLN